MKRERVGCEKERKETERYVRSRERKKISERKRNTDRQTDRQTNKQRPRHKEKKI